MNFYSKQSQQLQQRFGLRALADQLYATRRHTEFTDSDRSVIQEAQMFFLATADEHGHPDCSVKGGVPGFVKIAGENELLIPHYDGNGMFRSTGNIVANSHIGLLFVELEGQFRKLRINGVATVIDTPSLLEQFPGAQLLIRVTALDIFPNCPRYLPEPGSCEPSVFNPRQNYVPPEPFWKSKPDLRPFVLAARHQKSEIAEQALEDTECDRYETQLLLNKFYLRETAGPEGACDAPRPGEYSNIWRLEDSWNAHEEKRIGQFSLPDTAEQFGRWYFDLHRDHRNKVAPFFDFLANEATLPELAFYVGLEEQVDGRFDDVIALAQLGMSGDMKLALAENYWDEMGLGKEQDMHTILFKKSSSFLRAFNQGIDMSEIVPAEALKNGNLLMMYALRRRYGTRLLGALAILEHTAPYRFQKTVKGLERVGVPEDVIYYHRMHIEVDANHGKQLFNRVLAPLVKQTPSAIREVCVGCLIRYQVAMDYYASLKSAMEAHVPKQPHATLPVASTALAD